MNFDNERPIYLQIAESIYERILSGGLVPGERIPSVREFGAELGVNPNTVMRTYERLTYDGVITTSAASATSSPTMRVKRYFRRSGSSLWKKNFRPLSAESDSLE